jgi:hypothetical protein
VTARGVLLMTAAIALATPVGARAFPTGEQFDHDPMIQDGAGGIAFTGAPRWAGHTCAVCHNGGPKQVGLRLEAEPASLFADGWKPHVSYHLRVVLQHATLAGGSTALGDQCGFAVTPYVPCDDNGYAMEIDDSLGRPLGKLAPIDAAGGCGGAAGADPSSRVLRDGSAATMTGTHHGATSWDVCWTAPDAGYGPLIAYIAGVDGNGGDGTEDYPNDVGGDDVAAGAVPIIEAGAAPPVAQVGGCSATGAGPGAGVLVLIGALALIAVRARKRRLVAIAAVALLAQGCVHVRPRQRETLAQRKMTFSPDPNEDELDLHMQESREGASGGYGSAGGGCGCN